MEISASSSDPVSFYVLIAAAGSGSRLGGDVPKQYQKVAGKTILRHTLDSFLRCPGLQEIRVITDPAHSALYDDAAAGLGLGPAIAGSSSRKSSIYNGLNSFSNKLEEDDIILIHDAARSFVRPQDIEAVVKAAQSHKAATLAAPVADTQKYAGGDYIDRADLWAIQTPQGFHYGLIRQAHEQFRDREDFTDDTALAVALGYDAILVPGPARNFKITTQDDLEMAAMIMNGNAYETRTGTGFDVHAFGDTGDAVILGGVSIPTDKCLKGHSDADVALHAITDALFGAMAAGDIGSHFPPADPQWQGQDSAHFLAHACRMLAERDGKITHLDLTIICEHPKIGPHREAMQSRIAAICGIAEHRVSVKATTTEKLGFTGRGEGIAAQAAATIRLPTQDDHD